MEGLNELEDGSEIFLDLASSIPMVLALLQEGLFGTLAHLFLEDFAEALRSKIVRLDHIAHTSLVKFQCFVMIFFAEELGDLRIQVHQ